MNLALVILVIWQLESSQGKDMKHPQKQNHGHLGISDLAIIDINKRHPRYSPYTVEDTLNKNVAFTMAKLFINMYIKPEWTAREVLAFWRCGIKDMVCPTPKQQAYIDHGMRMYSALIRGDNKWAEVL